ncbi:MAG: hypothetical protein EA376_03400 [Phycisphaeraceae bacterium]|nr:MAG: hypothetical protein EA376_03400 [Phycisphaeraceae bacterium]
MSLFLLPSCSRSFVNENDRLRARVLELETSVLEATAERDELRARVSELRRAATIAVDPVESDTLDALPRCAGLQIGRLTGVSRRRATEEIIPLDVYLVPYDGRRRFVQVAGRLTVEALLLPAPGEQESSIRLASAELDPAELRDAYRSGLTGAFYVVNLELPTDADYLTGSLLVRAELFDGVTGSIHRAERVIPADRYGEYSGSSRRGGAGGAASRRP